jgi:hypothetical protein
MAAAYQPLCRVVQRTIYSQFNRADTTHDDHRRFQTSRVTSSP